MQVESNTNPAAGASPTICDPLIATIAAYRNGCAAFGRVKTKDYRKYGGEDGLVGQTYGPPLDALKCWSEPALSYQGAVAALRMAAEENRLFAGSEVVTTMLDAAISFLDGGCQPERNNRYVTRADRFTFHSDALATIMQEIFGGEWVHDMRFVQDYACVVTLSKGQIGGAA